MIRFAALLALLATPLAAQEVRDCGEMANAANIPEPWEAHTKSFANNRVRISVLDTIEPAAAAFQLLVLSPPFDEVGGRQCKIIGSANGLGFAGLTLDGNESSYDPAKGLTIGLPVRLYDAATGGFLDSRLLVTLNQGTGAVSAGIAP